MSGDAAQVRVNDQGVFRFELGEFECIVISDRPIDASAAFLFQNAPQYALDLALRAHGLTADHIPAGLSCLVVRTKGQVMLIDTGTGGRSHSGLGHLERGLASAGIDRDRIDIVLITHGHPDHIGGLLDEHGSLSFPNARFVLTRDEWEFWSTDETLARVPDDWASVARTVLPPIRDRLHLVRNETEVLPGLRAVPAPGHTPGHMAVSVASGNRQLLCMGDAVGHPITIEHPDWYVATDYDEELTRSTRLDLYDRAASGDTLVFANHFLFPAVGRVVRDNTGWHWCVDDRT